MITIDSLIGQMKNLFAIKTPVRFDTPEYIQFYSDLIQYIYENHFEESDEWKIISRNLVYTSTQRMAGRRRHNFDSIRCLEAQGTGTPFCG